MKLIGRLWRHPLAQNTFLLMIVQLSTYALPLVTLPFLSRRLGPDNFGLLSFSQWFIWYFVTLTDYGFNLTGTRAVAVHRDDPEKLSRYFCVITVAKLWLTILGFVLMGVTIALVPKLRPHWLLYTCSFLTVVGNFVFPLWFFQGLQQMKLIAGRDLGMKVLGTILLFAVIRRPEDYLWAALIQSGSPAIAGLIGLAQLRRVLPEFRWQWPTAAEVWTELRQGWAVFLSFAAMTLYTSTNTFLLYLYTTPADVGFYTAAQRLIVAARTMVTPAVTALYPHVSHLAARSRADAIQFLNRYAALLSLPFLAGSLVLGLGAPWIIRLIYGPLFEPAIPVLRIMSLSPFLLALSHAYSTFFMLAFGYDREWSRIVFLTAALNFVIFLPLLMFINPIHAISWTSVALDAVVLIASFLFYRRHRSRHSEIHTGVTPQ